ncbi:unnamed protein product [Litomosoides sigmodontis]|uniref:Uncharacterized protein n=1 Tax=Litomosoides sigmodontis TaxID=42156 RepID=A0A3P6T9X8_LITSI|nr:unnamed protein product [Litomosoides sigmodontis]
MVAEKSWMIPSGSCCEPDVTKCNRSHCFFAEVQGSSPFWISGCTDDQFDGNQASCDQYDIPYNSVLLRCQCQTDFCNSIDRIPRCSKEPLNNTATESRETHSLKGGAWANQISPVMLLIFVSGTTLC